jgi:hypothetical protein
VQQIVAAAHHQQHVVELVDLPARVPEKDDVHA